MRFPVAQFCLTAMFIIGLSPGVASAAVPGSKLTITFEGLAQGRVLRGIPNEYDGFNWGRDLSAAPKGAAKHDPGLLSVIRGKVAGVIPDGQASGIIVPVSGLFSLKSGYFAAFANSQLGTTFKAYRDGQIVGTMTADTTQIAKLIHFDKTFAKIDKLEIDGQVAFDNLKVTFEESPK